jgi:hypothetical protein
MKYRHLVKDPRSMDDVTRGARVSLVEAGDKNYGEH